MNGNEQRIGLLLMLLACGIVWIASHDGDATRFSDAGERNVFGVALDVLRGRDSYKYEGNSVYGHLLALTAVPKTYLEVREGAIPLPEIGGDRYTNVPLRIGPHLYGELLACFRHIHLIVAILGVLVFYGLARRTLDPVLAGVATLWMAMMPSYLLVSSKLTPVVAYAVLHNLVFWFMAEDRGDRTRINPIDVLTCVACAISTAILCRGALLFVVWVASRVRRSPRVAGIGLLIYLCTYTAVTPHLGFDLPLRLEDAAQSLVGLQGYDVDHWALFSSLAIDGGMLTVVLGSLAALAGYRRYVWFFVYAALYVVVAGTGGLAQNDVVVTLGMALILPAVHYASDLVARLRTGQKLYWKIALLCLCAVLPSVCRASMSPRQQAMSPVTAFDNLWPEVAWKSGPVFDFGKWVIGNTFVRAPVENRHLRWLDTTPGQSVLRIPRFQGDFAYASEIEKPDLRDRYPVHQKVWGQSFVAAGDTLRAVRVVGRNQSATPLSVSIEVLNESKEVVASSTIDARPAVLSVDYTFLLDPVYVGAGAILSLRILPQAHPGFDVLTGSNWYIHGQGSSSQLWGSAWQYPPNVPSFDLVFQVDY
ncbi:MAG: hypothetical protein CME19_18205 [Gemmatimonadetes bacterium]|nr:hypothetical protein [Gemmatimonadota bacterium]